MDLEPASLVSKQSVKDALILDETTVGTLQIGAMHLNSTGPRSLAGKGWFSTFAFASIASASSVIVV
jgi:hypothetical protein